MGDWVTIWIGASIGSFLAIVLLATVAFCFSRGFVRWAVGHFAKIVMNDRYPENIWEIVSALTRVSPQRCWKTACALRRAPRLTGRSARRENF